MWSKLKRFLLPYRKDIRVLRDTYNMDIEIQAERIRKLNERHRTLQIRLRGLTQKAKELENAQLAEMSKQAQKTNEVLNEYERVSNPADIDQIREKIPVMEMSSMNDYKRVVKHIEDIASETQGIMKERQAMEKTLSQLRERFQKDIH